MNIDVKSSKSGANSRKRLDPKSGIFITFEGGEGVGKSSQITKLKEKFEKLGYNVLLTREPGGSSGAEAVRHVLLSGAAEPLGSDVEAILFSAARADHVSTVIKPALKKNMVVICDRFFDSTRVYQGVSGKASEALLDQLERVAVDGAWPDLTLILDIDPKEGMERAGKRRGLLEKPDRFEKESIAQQTKRRKAFLAIAKKEPERCKVVDATGSIAQVGAKVWKAVSLYLDKQDNKSATKLKTKPSKKTTIKKAPKLSHKALTKKK